jgi:nucleoid-associated protein YgaU
MSIRWLIICGVLLLLTACAKPPRQALDATEYLVARAYSYQAANYASEEYQAAFAAFEEGRRLIAKRDYRSAEAALALSRQHALRAYSLTEIAKAREVAEAEIRRAAEEEARVRAEEARKAEEEARKAAEVSMLSEYRVGGNDTLASVAGLVGVYGDPLLWPLLYQANRDQIKDPAQIYIGQVLKVPRGLPSSDLESARQKAREAGLFGIASGNGGKLPPDR